MTEIEALYEENEFYLTIKGHADYAEYGKDIVCSSVSILAFSLQKYLADHEDELERLCIDGDDGVMVFSCKIDDYHEHDLRQGIMAIVGGFEILSKNYEKNVHFSPKGNIFDKSFT